MILSSKPTHPEEEREERPCQREMKEGYAVGSVAVGH